MGMSDQLDQDTYVRSDKKNWIVAVQQDPRQNKLRHKIYAKHKYVTSESINISRGLQ